MYNVSTAFITAIKQPNRIVSSKVVIGSNTYLDDNIVSMEYSDTSNPDIEFEIGSVSSATIKLVLLNVNEQFETVTYKPSIGIQLPDQSIEWVPLGVFSADIPKRNKNTVELTLYDSMIKMEQLYVSQLTYPATITDMMNEACSIAGVTFSGTLPNYTVQAKPTGYKCREVVGLIAQMCAGFAKFDRSGNLKIKTYATTTSESLTTDNYIKNGFEKKKDVNYRLDAITVQTDDSGTTITQGTVTAGGSELTFKNPWFTNAILTDVYNKLNGFSFLPASIKAQGNPSTECGDLVAFTDSYGDSYNIPIMKIDLTYDGGLIYTLESEGESEDRNQFNTAGSVNQVISRTNADLLATNARINNLTVSTAMINDLSVTNAKIADEAVGTSKIGNLSVTTAKVANAAIGDAQIDRASANKLVVGTADIKDAAVTSLKVANASIQNAHLDRTTANKVQIIDADIANVNAAKLTAGILNTSKVTVQGNNGHLKLQNNRLQVFDNQTTPVERISLGDVNADGSVYGLRVRGADGTTVLYDQDGVYNEGITNGAITNPKISNDAVDGRVIAAQSVTASHMVTGTITATSGVIADAAITTAMIKDATITDAKITGLLSASRIQVDSTTRFASNYDPSSKVGIGTAYNGVVIDDVNGFKTVRSDSLVQTIMNSTTGIKIQNRSASTDPWADAFYVDTNGIINGHGMNINSGNITGGTINGASFTSAYSGTNSVGINYDATMTLDYGTVEFTTVEHINPGGAYPDMNWDTKYQTFGFSADATNPEHEIHWGLNSSGMWFNQAYSYYWGGFNIGVEYTQRNQVNFNSNNASLAIGTTSSMSYLNQPDATDHSSEFPILISNNKLTLQTYVNPNVTNDIDYIDIKSKLQISGSSTGQSFEATGYITSNSGGSYSNYWSKVASITITQQYADADCIIDFFSRGLAGEGQKGRIKFRVKQQDTMGSAPYVYVKLTENEHCSYSDVVAVTTTNSTSQTIVQLWIRNRFGYQEMVFTPILQNGVVFYHKSGIQAGLPSGAQTTSGYITGDFYSVYLGSDNASSSDKILSFVETNGMYLDKFGNFHPYDPTNMNSTAYWQFESTTNTARLKIPWAVSGGPVEIDGNRAITDNKQVYTPGFQNGWVNYGGGYAYAHAIKLDNNTVMLEGLIKGGTMNTQAFTLPAGFYPSVRHVFPSVCGSGIGRVDVESNGKVTIASGSNDFITLSGIIFNV